MTRRHAIVLPVLCWNRLRRDFYAVTADVSREGIRLKSSVVLAPGEDLTCSIRQIGQVEARIVRAQGQESVVAVRGHRSHIRDVVRQFVVLSRQQRDRPEPIRVEPRIVPAQKVVSITLEGGSSVPGHVLNISASSVALLVDRPLELGERILVGTKRARIARHFKHGVGAAFTEPFDPSAVHERMRL